MKHLKLSLLAALLATSVATRADEPQKLTIDMSGWVLVNTFANRGDLDSRELPRYALVNNPALDQRAFGMAARQSRLRMAIGIPTDGFMASAVLKGFVEGDFMGSVGGDVSSVIPRLRHAYVSAAWKDLYNLTLTVGQTWGVAPGPYFASSLAHAAMPRFGGAGFLYRRAPQVRLAADVPAGPVNVVATGAVLTPGDVGSTESKSVGNDAAFPNLEARVAGQYKQDGKQLAELGLWTHYGRERYDTNTTLATITNDVTTNSQAFGLDVKVDLPYVTLVGGVFQGENLDVLASIAGLTTTGTGAIKTGVILDATDPANPKARNIKTQGGFAQAIVTPVKGVQLVAGLGIENPDDKTLALPGSLPAENAILKNEQLSAGTIVNITSKWRVSFEATRYLTTVRNSAAANGRDVLPATQFEIGSLLAL